MPFFCGIDPHQGPVKLGLCLLKIPVGNPTLSKAGLSPFLRFPGTLYVNLIAPFPGGRNQTALPVHHRQHTANAGGAAARPVFHHYLGGTHSNGSALVAVPCKDCKIAVDGTAGYALNLAVKYRPVHGHNL